MQLSQSWLGNCPVLEKEIIDGINKTHKIHITHLRPPSFNLCPFSYRKKMGLNHFPSSSAFGRSTLIPRLGLVTVISNSQ